MNRRKSCFYANYIWDRKIDFLKFSKILKVYIQIDSYNFDANHLRFWLFVRALKMSAQSTSTVAFKIRIFRIHERLRFFFVLITALVLLLCYVSGLYTNINQYINIVVVGVRYSLKSYRNNKQTMDTWNTLEVQKLSRKKIT